MSRGSFLPLDKCFGFESRRSFSSKGGKNITLASPAPLQNKGRNERKRERILCNRHLPRDRRIAISQELICVDCRAIKFHTGASEGTRRKFSVSCPVDHFQKSLNESKLSNPKPKFVPSLITRICINLSVHGVVKIISRYSANHLTSITGDFL